MAKTFKEYLEDFGSSDLFGFDSMTGQIIPQTSNVLSAIKELMNDTFDNKLNVEPETPAGVLCMAWAFTYARFCAVTAAYANQINPNYATGQMLDAVGSLFSIVRGGATPTVISVVLSGSVGTIIPDGSIISDSAGNEFAISGNITIGSGGTVSANAVCTKTGPIEVDDGTVTTIVSTVVGWLAVTNTGIVTAGTSIESDEHYRSRVKMARWIGSSFVDDIRSEIERQPNVNTVVVVENGEDSPMYYTDQNTFVYTQPQSGKYIKLNPHSICVIVYGTSISADDNQSIARAIYSTKSAGCNITKLDAATQGTAKGTVVTSIVQDEHSAAQYSISFNKPNVVSFSCNVTVGRGSYTGTDEELKIAVKEAMKAWANGTVPFVDGLKLGQSLYAFEIGAAISDVIPSIQIKNVSIIVEGDEVSSHELFVYEIGSLDIADTTVTIS